MSEHSHSEYVDGCDRCDLSRDEVEDSYRIALRPECDEMELLDDVVVKNVSMFRAEMMDEDRLWMCCYFPDTEQRITFSVRAVKEKGKPRLMFTSSEQPHESDEFSYEPISAAGSGVTGKDNE